MALVPYRGDVLTQLGLIRPRDASSELDDYITYLKSLNPSDWKTHDHYRVLRLDHRRFEASQEEIQKSYRDIAKRFHPDKCPGTDFYYCNVIRSSELLLDPIRRRAFDSVDPTFDDSIPDSVPEDDFYAKYGAIFKSNARFSVRQPVPRFGTTNSTISEVNDFYRFWFDFESWREFSYLDEEDKSKGQDKMERSQVERRRREKDEMKRIHALVQKAYDNDPRIKEFKEEEKRLKRERRVQRKKIMEVKVEDEKPDTVEENCQTSTENEQFNKPIGEERKKFKTFVRNLEWPLADDRIRMIARADRMMFGSDYDALEAINQRLKLESDANGDVFNLLVDLVEKFEICEAEAKRKEQTYSKTVPPKSKITKGWTHDELEFLVKAVRAYPPGTSGRWITITEFVNKHLNDDVKCDSLKDFMLTCFGNHIETTEAWTTEEQHLLEQGLRKYGPSENERWSKIAELLPSRTARECMLRYKLLVEKLKKKREAAK
ncbi:hypothetical protein ACOME3_009765 [Neoechinorhynchus agilis]